MTAPIDASPLRSVTSEEIEAYDRDGVVLLRGIYPRAWVDELRRALDAVFARESTGVVDPAAIEGTSSSGIRTDVTELARAIQSIRPDLDLSTDGEAAQPITGRSLLETDVSIWNERMRNHNTVGPLPEIVAAVTQSERVNFYSDQLFCKEPGSRMRTPFHQDKSYFLMQGDKVAVCWVTVDRVDRENGAMGYVRGSHRWGATYKPSDFVSRTDSFPEVGGMSHAGLSELPRIEGHEDEFDVVYFDAEPGDVIVHHWGTLHGSTGNVSAGRIRRAASVRYAGDGCSFYARASSPEPFRNTVELADGDPLEKAERFPVVWPR